MRNGIIPGIGIPYVSITFSANTEILDLLQSIAPETVDETGNVCSVAELVKEYPDSLELCIGSSCKLRENHRQT